MNILKKCIILIVSIVLIIIIKNFLLNKNESQYYGYLSIPRIGMYLPFYEPNNVLNNVNKNIELIDTGIKDTYLIAGHSGTGKVSFFNNLKYLVEGDIIYLNIDNNKQKYEIVNIYNEKKNGKLKIKNEPDWLVLTTCNQELRGYQLIIESYCVK